MIENCSFCRTVLSLSNKVIPVLSPYIILSSLIVILVYTAPLYADAVNDEFQGLPPKGEFINPTTRPGKPKTTKETEKVGMPALPVKNKIGMREPKTLEVGPGKEFSTPGMAAKYAIDGDLIEIDPQGDYRNDSVIWKNNDLTIRGKNGMARIYGDTLIGNGKGLWVIKGNNTKIENIMFEGASVRDKNGAGIRLEGKNLHVSSCKFVRNENGILTGRSPDSEVLIEHSEFAYNGYGFGKTHNLYIGAIKKLTFRFNISHHAVVGHNLKSRAKENYIVYNRMYDDVDGRSSYLIDISNGGNALVMGNILQQGPQTENWALMSYGAEGLRYKENNLIVTYNTFVNQRHSGVFINLKNGGGALVVNNIFTGKGKVTKNDSVHLINNITPDINPKLADPNKLDMSLQKNSPAIDKAVYVADWNKRELYPLYQNVNNKFIKRKLMGKKYDIGAKEFYAGSESEFH